MFYLGAARGHSHADFLGNRLNVIEAFPGIIEDYITCERCLPTIVPEEESFAGHEGGSISTKPESINYQVVREISPRLLYECSNLDLKVSQYIWKTESEEDILDKPFVLWANTFPIEFTSSVVAQRGHFIEFLSLG